MWGDTLRFLAEDSHKTDTREMALVPRPPFGDGVSAPVPSQQGSRQQAEEGGCREGLSSRLFLTLSTQLGPTVPGPWLLPLDTAGGVPPRGPCWAETRRSEQVLGARKMNGCFG